MTSGEAEAGAPVSVEELRAQSMGELVKQLAEETSVLVRQELDLAKAELVQKGKQAGVGAGMFGGAGLIGFLCLQVLTACAILALALAMPGWLAALIVGLVYAAVAAVLVLQGRVQLRRAVPPTPTQTVETLKEDVEWAKSQMRSERR